MQIFWMSVIYVISALFGAKLVGIFICYINDPLQSRELILKSAGMAFLGGPALGLVSIWIYSAFTRTYFLDNTDYVAPFFMLCRAIGRFGCLMEGCCYGVPSKLPWAIRTQFEQDYSHPTQGYALIGALAIFITTRIYYKTIRPYKGLTFFMIIALYSFLRFFNEFLRVDSIQVLGPLQLSHLVMIALFVIGVVGVYSSSKTMPGREKELVGFLKLFGLVLFSSATVVLSALSLIR